MIYGAGGHGRVCLDIARAAGLSVAGFCDSAAPKGSRIHGCEVIANDPAELAGEPGLRFFPAIGGQEARRRVLLAMESARLAMASLIHPDASVSPAASVGAGSAVMAGAVIATDATIARGCIVNHGATVDHDCQLGVGVKVGPGANLAGGVMVGAWSDIGTGAALVPGVSVGENTTVGAGAVVIRDIGANLTVVGVPARPLRAEDR